MPRDFQLQETISRSGPPAPPVIKAIGGGRWTVAYWLWPRFNFYVRVGSRSVFWRQP